MITRMILFVFALHFISCRPISNSSVKEELLPADDPIFVISAPMSWDEANAKFSLNLEISHKLGCDAFGGRLPSHSELKKFDRQLPERRTYWTADLSDLDKDAALTYIPGTGFRRSKAKYEELWVACIRTVSQELLAQRILNTSVAHGQKGEKKLVFLPHTMDWESARAKFDGQIYPDKVPGCEAYGMRLPTFKELTELTRSKNIEGLNQRYYANSYWSQDEDPTDATFAFAFKHPRFDNPQADAGREPRAMDRHEKIKLLNVLCI